MCTDDANYNHLGEYIFGGATGNYSMYAPIESADWVEYSVVTIANGDGGPGAAIISGRNAPSAGLDYTGLAANRLDASNSASVPGQAYRIGQYTTLVPPERWRRIVSSEGKVFARIDAQSNTSLYITIAFRARILKTIPAPFRTVHPDDMQAMHEARADKIQQAVLGKEGEREVYPRTLKGMVDTMRIKGQ